VTACPNHIQKSKSAASSNQLSCYSVKLEAALTPWGEHPTVRVKLSHRLIFPVQFSDYGLVLTLPSAAAYL